MLTKKGLLVVSTSTFLGDYNLEKVGKSTVKKKTLNPVWHEFFWISITKPNMALVIDIFDENRITRDDFLGRVMLRLNAIQPDQDILNTKLQGRSERSRVSGEFYV